MNTKQRTRFDDEDEFIFPTGKNLLDFSVKSRQINNFIVHINQDIKGPDYYSRIFDMLLEAGESDMVSFFIASPGGRIDGLNVLLEGIRLTDAHTVAIIIGEASSAASILALNCNEVVVTASAEALIHSCRFGSSGKAADIAAHTQHTLKTTERLARETYEGFLTPDELQQMLDGKEFYFDAEQLEERLAERVEYMEAKYEAEQKAASQVQEQPKKPSRKKTPPRE